MASKVSICNLALGFLGDEATVSSLDPPEGSVQADHCATWYPIARDAILEAHAWNYATTRAALTEHASIDPPASWAYAYTVPNGCLRALALLVPGADDGADGQDFVIEEYDQTTRLLYCNVQDAELRFIFRQDDPGRYSGQFVIALARLLASFLAGPLIKGSEGIKVAQGMRELYEKVDLPRAKAQDANNRKLASYTNARSAAHAYRA